MRNKEFQEGYNFFDEFQALAYEEISNDKKIAQKIYDNFVQKSSPYKRYSKKYKDWIDGHNKALLDHKKDWFEIFF